MSKRRAEERTVHLILAAWIALAVSASAVLAQTPCDAAEILPLDTALHRSSPSDVFRLPVAEPGLLALDVAAAIDAASPARFAFLGTGCAATSADDGTAWVRLRETPRELWLRVLAPTELYVEVAAEDRNEPLDGYALQSAFVPARLPAGRLVPRKEVDPVEDDVISGLIGEVCEEPADDHSDRASCGTELLPGAEVFGVVDNTAGADDDYFQFELGHQQTVAIDLLGTEGVRAVLYDGVGQRLDAWDAASLLDPPTAGRLVRTLGPDTFYLRVGSVADWGEYAVALTAPLP